MPGFKSIDITFKGGRKQSEVANELGITKQQEEEVKVPISGTPEQMINYFMECVASTDSPKMKGVYLHTIKLIKELLEVKRELRVYQLKEMMAGMSEEKEESDVFSEE